MTSDRQLTKGRNAAVAFLVIAFLAVGSAADAQVRLLVPEESPSGPFYARIERGVVLQDDGWIAIAFYREPACVRDNFNLLNFFDFANIPAIFSCPLTVSGFEIWRDPSSDAGPRQSKLRGNGGVPIWFVTAAEFSAALPGITMAELRAMPSLMEGIATDFEETLHPLGAAQQAVLEIVARGNLPDGRRFHLAAAEAAGELRFVGIEFR